jgi:hypothetical protein
MGTHDSLFHHAFTNVEHARGVLATALPREIAAQIDFASLAVKKTSFVDETLSHHYADILYSGRIAGREGLLYLLWEHKSAPEPLTPLQVLRYIVRIWEEHVAERSARRKAEGAKAPRTPVKLPVILVVVLHNGPGGWTAATRLEDLLDADEALLAVLGDYVPRLRLVVDDLAAQADEHLHARAATGFARLVLWCLKNARDAGWLREEHRLWKALIGEVLGEPDGVKMLAALFRYIIGTSPTARPDVLRGLLPSGRVPEVEEAVMNWYQEQIEQTRKDARRDGEQGLLLKQLRKRFGELPPDVVARVDEADVSLLDLWGERVLTAARLDDVLAPA